MYFFERCFKCDKCFEFGDPDKVRMCALNFADFKDIKETPENLFCRVYCRECALDVSKKIKNEEI